MQPQFASRRPSEKAELKADVALNPTSGGKALVGAPAGLPLFLNPVSLGVIQRCGALPCDCPQELREEQVMRQPAVGSAEPAAAPHSVGDVLRTSGRPLEPAVRAFLEPRFGTDFGDVRVHTDETAARAVDAVGAAAFTVGNLISFGRGMYQPGTPSGLRMLAHELTHTLQQRGHGAAQPSLRVGPANDPAESSADRVADAVLAGQPVPQSPVEKQPQLQRWSPSWSDLVELYEWSNPVTFSEKLFREATDIEPDLWPVLERLVRQSATEISIPPEHIINLKRYANAVPDDGKILCDALGEGPSYYQGGLLLKLNSSAEAMTFGNSIFFTRAPSAHTYVHEMVHIHQYHRLGRGGFVTSYFGMSLATILWRLMNGDPVNVMDSSPHERQAYELEQRFRDWLDKNPLEHEEEKTSPVTRHQTHSVYFEYAKPEFARHGRAAELDMQSKAEVQQALAAGYRVDAIRGYASPEGSVEATKTFVGNRKLSEQRAEAAEAWVRALCMPLSLFGPRPNCFGDSYARSGVGELYGSGPSGTELAEKDLPEHAVGEFRTQPAEASRRTPEVMKELEERKTAHGETETVYPLLRRAEIDLSKEDTEVRKVTVRESEPADCPT